jgi:hypothetical protein
MEMNMKKAFLILALAAAATFAAVDLVNMPVNTWVQIPNTHLSSVAPSGWSANVIDAWGGAALDTKRNRLIVWGGGHNDYYGNELYSYEIDNEKWVRLTNPTANYTTCADNNSDGTPVSRHTYNGLTYIAGVDRFFGIGGCPGCPNGGCGINKTWTYDFANSRWENRNPSGTLPGTCCGDLCAYDPATGKVYFGDSGAWACGSSKYGLYVYNFATNTWTKLTSDMFCGSMAVDTRRHVLLNIGNVSGYDSTWVTSFDLNQTAPTRVKWATTGGNSGAIKSRIDLTYDSLADKYVVWDGSLVWTLDPVTKAWSSHSAAGGPSNSVYGVTNGVYGRWQYVPKVNAYVVVTGIDLNVYFYKLTAGMGLAAEKSALPTSVPMSINAMPNPFRGTTEISLTGGPVRHLALLDLQGRVVRDLTSALKDDGGNVVRLDATGMPAGVYLLKAQAGGKTLVKTLLLAK